MPLIQPDTDASLTDRIVTTFGSFNIGNFRVPYMSSILRVQQVAEYLKLVTDDPKYANLDWDIKELYQREVDVKRVIDMADNYLDPNHVNRPPFFNSLTVVLSPSNDIDHYTPPPERDDMPFSLAMGPIRVSYQKKTDDNFPKECSLGYVQWNRDQVYGVAIDGQHRLAALKHLYANNPLVAANLTVSVIFLIISKDFGFKVPDHFKYDPTSHMRSIFIDLNKHAVTVSKARNLLLDDLDPIARFVRSLIGPSLSYEIDSSAEQDIFTAGTHGEFTTCLPLSLVDWHGESKSKVDEGPYITSILALDWIVKKILRNCNKPNLPIIDMNKYSLDDVDYYSSLQKVLSKWSESWEQSIESNWTAAKENELPLILSNEDLDNIDKEFSKHWCKAITYLLSATGPYKYLIDKRIEILSVNPQFSQWYQAKAAYESQRRSPRAITDKFKHRLDIVTEELKRNNISISSYLQFIEDINAFKEENLFYLLVGQRSLIISLYTLISTDKMIFWIDYTDYDIEDFQNCPEKFYANYLVEPLNKLFQSYDIHSKLDGNNIFYKQCKCLEREDHMPDHLSDLFWAGSLVRRESPDMDFSDAAALRGSKWFILIAHLYWFIKLNHDGVNKNDILDSLDNPSYISDNYDLGQELVTSIGGINDEGIYRSPMWYLASLDPNEYGEVKEDVITGLAYERIAFLCRLFGLE